MSYRTGIRERRDWQSAEQTDGSVDTKQQIADSQDASHGCQIAESHDAWQGFQTTDSLLPGDARLGCQQSYPVFDIIAIQFL